MARQTADAPAPRARFRPHTGFVVANALFAAVFVVLVLSEFHAPSPHGLPVGIVGPAAMISHVQAALGHAVPGGFALQSYASEAAAQTAITHGQVSGALVNVAGRLHLLVAQGAGSAPTQTLTTAFAAVAAHSGQSLTVTDVVPALPGDSLALSPFFIVLGLLVPSVAAGSSSALVFRRSRPAWGVAAPVVAAVVGGAAAAGIADGIAGLGHYLAIAGIAALFSVAVAASTAALGRIWPPLVAVAVLVHVVFALPASGGPSNLAAFGPEFLRVLHPALPLGVAASALRSVIYFDGYGVAGPLWALAAWAIAGLAALTLVTTLRRRRAARPSGRGAAVVAPPSLDGHVTLAPADIVVGFDNSGPARRALSHAAELAAARHRVLHIVYSGHVLIDSDLSGFGYGEMEAAREQEAAAVAQAAADIAAKAGVTYTFEESQDAPAEAILTAAKSLAAENEHSPVIVVGRSGHAARHPLGSVPTHLVHHSPYPVLTIP
jgi:nucleotide-binding universal stress UspA family protein